MLSDIQNAFLPKLLFSYRLLNARWPGPKAGCAMASAGKHFWALIFFVLFASRQKVHKQTLR
jgi:hypothetical protein